MAKYNKGLKIAGFEAWHAGNHGSEGNPHNQYVLKQVGTLKEAANLIGKWAIIARFKADAQYQFNTSVLSIAGGVSGAATSPFALVYFRVKQQEALGSRPNVELVLLIGKHIYTSNFKAITVKNDTTETVVELYMRNDYNYENYNIRLVHERGKPLETFYNPDYIDYSQLPTGTITDCGFLDVQFGSIKSDGYDVLNTYNYNVGYFTTDTQATDAEKYTKLGEINITESYGQTACVLSVMGASAGITVTPLATLFWRVKIQGTLGQVQPYVELYLLDAIGFSDPYNRFYAVVTSNTSSGCKVELYMKVPNSYEAINYHALHSYENKYITWTSNQPFITSLPSGTQYMASYNPHPQYALVSQSYADWRTPDSDGDTTKYTKIGTITLRSRYQYKGVIIHFMSVGQSTDAIYGNIFFRAQQQYAMPSNPIVEVVLSDIHCGSVKFSESDIVAVITSTTSTSSVVELYVKNIPQYDRFFFTLVREEGTGTFTKSSQSDFITKLPTGTQTAGKSDAKDSITLRSLNGTNYKLTVDNTGRLLINGVVVGTQT